MRRNILLVYIPVILAIVLMMTFLVEAQATRTWISGVGDDANPCSRTAPCKTFAGAISKTAGGGEINCLDPGGFGAVTITKSITLDCSGTFGSTLASMTNGIVINTTDTIKTVRIRGITINGTGNGVNGIRVIAAARVYIENTVIDGFTQHGISLENAANLQIFIDNSSIRNNGGSGINGAPAGAADVSVTRSSISGNGTGLMAGANATFRIYGNSIVFNTTGLSAAAKGKIISFGGNMLDANGTDGKPTMTGVLQ
jgi:Right handed beta helix region